MRLYPASYNQKQLWTFAQFSPNSTTYNVHRFFHFATSLDIPLFHQTIEKITERHEILRTTFKEEKGVLWQCVHEKMPFTSGIIDSSRMSEVEIKAKAIELSMQNYDLEKGPLTRLYFFVSSPSSVSVLICNHHIVWDAWSGGVFFNEISAIYSALKNNRPIPLPPLHLQYRDLSQWQTALIASPKGQEQLRYWQNILLNMHPLEFPMAKKKFPRREYKGELVPFTIENDLSKRIYQALSENHITLHMFLIAAYLITLYHYTQEPDITIRIPIPGRLRIDDGRQRIDFSDNIGYFVNPNVFRIQILPEKTIAEFLKLVREITQDGRRHQDFPLLALLEKIPFRIPEIGFNLVRPRPGDNFSSTTVYSNSAKLIELGELRFSSLSIPQQSDLLDINFLIIETSKELTGNLYYRSDVMDKVTAERFANHFTQVLIQMVKNPQLRVSQVGLLTPSEKQQLLLDRNATTQPYPSEQTLVTLFESQAHRTPDQVALVFGTQQWSYHQLAARAHQLAHRLRREGVGNNQIVGILVEQSADIVIGIMGILESGAAYLPIDPNYPPSRIEYMLKDSGACVLVTHGRFKTMVGKVVKTTVDLQDPALNQESNLMPKPVNSPRDLAYMIYTSGSTGLPKGTMITHRNALNYLTWAMRYYRLDQGCGSPLHSSIAFDLTVTSLFPALLSGKVVHVTAEGIDGLVSALERQPNFSLIKLTPAHLRVLQSTLSPRTLRSLRGVFVVGGEAFLAEDIEFLRSANPHVRIVNEYGPTETTVGCCIYEVDATSPSSGPLPIGLPIANTQLYVLNDAMQPVPIGVTGELYIGGDSVGVGYKGRVDLTESRFVPNPFSLNSADRLYKTGDVVKWSTNGCYLEYIGRNDFQVKVKGYRIELGEIEVAIARLASVQECVVVVREDIPGQKQLVAYVVFRIPDMERLKQRMKTQLPDYMVPTYWVQMDKLPLNINGKVDRKALPAPERTSTTSSADYVAPRTEREKQLCTIWSELLRIDKVGIHSNFFELGGDSIIGILMISRAKNLGIQLNMRQIVNSPTIVQLASLAEGAEVKSSPQELTKFDKTDPIPLTPIQHWFFERNLPSPNHYIMSLPLLAVNGSLNVPCLEQALQIIAQQHDALRMRFKKDKDGWKQYVTNDDKVTCVEYHFSSLSAAEQQRAFQQASISLRSSLDIEKGPIFKAGLFHTSEGQRLLLFAHHLVIDGVSWRVLLEELQQLYLQLSQGKPVALPTPSTSFQAWAHALQSHGQSTAMRTELVYWQQAQKKSVTKLPRDFKEKNHSTKSSMIADYVITLSPASTRLLIQEAPKTYRTQINDILLTALVLAFQSLTGEPSLYLTLEGHGREDMIEGADLSRTFGWFTAMFPVNLHLENPEDLEKSLKSIQGQLAAIPHKGMGYGVLRYLSNFLEAKTLRDQPIPEVIFNYFGQMDDRISNPLGMFRFIQERSKRFVSNDNAPAAILDIQCLVIHGSLSVIIFYDSNAYREETVIRLAKSFQTALENLIQHCCKKTLTTSQTDVFKDKKKSQIHDDSQSQTTMRPAILSKL